MLLLHTSQGAATSHLCIVLYCYAILIYTLITNNCGAKYKTIHIIIKSASIKVILLIIYVVLKKIMYRLRETHTHTSSYSCLGKTAAWIKYEALCISCRSRCVLNGDVYGQQIGALRRGRESQSPSSRWSDTRCTFPQGSGWIWSADEDDDGVAMWSIIPSVSPLFLPLSCRSYFSLLYILYVC